jgi:AcrR family transcriptional regulator
MLRNSGSRTVAGATSRLPSVANATEKGQGVASGGENGLESTSVAGICRRARVNRATFYRHFEDKSDLLERGLESLLAEIGDRIDPPSVEEGRRPESVKRRIELLFELVEEKAGLFGLLLSGTASPALRDKVEAFCESYIEARRLARLSSPDESFSLPREAIPRALASLFTAIASWWLERPGAYTAREMAGYYLAFLGGGVLGPRIPQPEAGGSSAASFRGSA